MRNTLGKVLTKIHPPGYIHRPLSLSNEDHFHLHLSHLFDAYKNSVAWSTQPLPVTLDLA